MSDRSSFVGTAVRRREDPLLVSGRGLFLEDEIPSDALHLSFIRSPFARARIVSIDTELAQAMDGVVAVVTADELQPSDLEVPVVWRSPGLLIPRYEALASNRVSHAGQPVVAVVATSRSSAEDAAALVDIDYDIEDPVTSIDKAAENSSLVHPDLGTNVAYQTTSATGDIETAFASAHLVVSGVFNTPRQTALPMQRRGCLASFNHRSGKLSVRATVQHPHLLKEHLAESLGLADEQVHVYVGDLGGAFGAYYEIYPEDLVVASLALTYRKPIVWVEDRMEGFLTTVHARAQQHTAELALAADGRILGLRANIDVDVGAFIDYSGVGPAALTLVSMTGPYVVPALATQLRCLFTNLVRVGAYRGFGQPEAVFTLERLMDMAADQLAIDPLEIRRRNAVRSFPYQSSAGPVLDSGDFAGLLDLGQALLDRGPRVGPPAKGWQRGCGVAMYVEMTGTGPSKHMRARGYMTGGWEAATAEVTSTGNLRIYSGASHLGQGIRTSLAQICAEQFGIDPYSIEVITGDTDLVRSGNRGSIGSRSAVIAGQAVHEAAMALRSRVLRVASHLLEVGAEDLRLADGKVMVAGAPGEEVTLRALYREVRMRHLIPPEEDADLIETKFWEPQGLSYASGLHIAWVDVDLDTGRVRVVDYGVAHDCGIVINPLNVEGQVRGGTVQGFGAALLEELIYDEWGQLRTGSLMDYLVPLASDVVDFTIEHQETPAPNVPLGAKGCGEAGIIAPPAAIVNAVANAIGQHPDLNALPLHAERVWRVIDAQGA